MVFPDVSVASCVNSVKPRDYEYMVKQCVEAFDKLRTR